MSSIPDQPESAEAINNCGLERRAKGDLEGALADFNRAIELKTDLAVALVENNLTVANMGFEEFAVATDEKGVFRGF